MKLKSFLKKNINQKTLLGIGPVSKNSVDAAIEISNNNNFPVMLIASRRQIDSKDLGGGYVNNWNTQSFSEYVLNRDKNNNIILCRDHGGPWQGSDEVSLNEADAIETAKSSFATDIECNFKLLHIDPSINSVSETDKSTYDKVEKLLLFCDEYSKHLNLSDIIYEIGTEEQNSSIHNPDDLRVHLNKINHFCISSGIDMPIFQVVQTGTKVMEDKNIGNASKLVNEKDKNNWLISISNLQKVCSEYGVFLKEHNTDYLDERLLTLRPKSGISASNVAPEFGVYETIEIINFLDQYNLLKHKEKFLELSFKSNKWKKWMINKDSASDLEKAIISGHYVFGSYDFEDIMKTAVSSISKDMDYINNRLKQVLLKVMMKYIVSFKLIRL